MRISYTYSNTHPTENFSFSANKAIVKIPHLNFLYEKDNHLGSVITTVSDRKLGVDVNTDNFADYYTADILSATDYYSHGSV
ncbi:MAG: hypothetical protein WBM13_06340, partial [Bacteroidia bacterium]